MSQENLEVVRSSYERLNQTGELNRDDYAVDATFDASRLPGFGVYSGFDEFNAAWSAYRDTLTTGGLRSKSYSTAKGTVSLPPCGRRSDEGVWLRSPTAGLPRVRASGGEDRCLDGVLGAVRSPRSRRAAGVGDVAGERGGRASAVRRCEPPG
jgi:hypothetical protein